MENDRADRTTRKVDYENRKPTKDLDPITEEECADFDVINESTQIKDQNGETVIRYETGVVSKTLRNGAYSATTIIENHVTANCKNTTSIHAGHWCRFKKKSPIFRSRDLKDVLALSSKLSRYTPFFQNRSMREIFGLVDWWFHRINRPLFEKYCAIQTKEPRFGCKSFLMTVINFEASGPHYDAMDEYEGLCCVIPFGNPTEDWQGGDLVFRDLKLRFPMRPGDIIFFRSRELLHENLPVQGERRSFVFCTDHNSFLSPGQTIERKYKNFAHLNINPESWDEMSDEECDIDFDFTHEDDLYLYY